MSKLEIVAVLLGLAYVLLMSFSKRIGWIFGILSCGIYIGLFFESQLYLQSILQSVYVIMGVYGYFSWGKAHAKISSMQLKQHFQWGIPTVMMAVCLAYSSSFYGQKMPYLDAFITSFSILATYFATRMWIENWLYWFVLNFLAAYMFWEQGLLLTSGLFIINASLAVFGYFQWKKGWHEEL